MLELKIKKDDLTRGVSQTSAIAEKRSSMPILSNILLEAEGDCLKLTATDLEISFQGSFPAEVIFPGKITVPGRKFNEIVRLLNADEVSLGEDENLTLKLCAGQFSTKMYGLSPADFPQMPQIDDLTLLELESASLIGVIDRTIFSIATEETRYNLSGAFIEKRTEEDGNQTLRFVSTDGHRLNLASLPLPAENELEMPDGALISKKGLAELKRLAEGAEKVKLGLATTSLVAQTETATLVMRLLDGRFPDYNLVIPKDNDKSFLAPRQVMLEALKRIATMSSDDYKTVKFKLEPGRLTISAMTPELGQAEESLAVEYDGPELEAGFNPRFYTEALSALASETIRLSLLDADKPALLTAAEDPGYLGVVMTMKI